MFTLERLIMFGYVLSILTGSYLAVSTLKNLYGEARELERLASLQIEEMNAQDDHKLLVFDAIEPAAGGN